jgi:hypothetical protein
MCKEVCICAAIRDERGYLWRGHRHAEGVLKCTLLGLEKG